MHQERSQRREKIQILMKESITISGNDRMMMCRQSDDKIFNPFFSFFLCFLYSISLVFFNHCLDLKESTKYFRCLFFDLSL